MNVLSLFDGMSCGQIALERAGIKVDNYFASEIDDYAISLTQKNYPNTVQLGDVTNYPFWLLPEIDLVTFGSPCQGFSYAGKQLNFEDPRSKLFFTACDILKECKPTHFLMENVKMKKEQQDVISSMLGVEPIEINSRLVSAQNRERLYWTNIPNVTQPKDKGQVLSDIINDYIAFDKPYNCYGHRETKNYIQFDVSGKGHNSQQDRAYYIEGKFGTFANARAITKRKITDRSGFYRDLTLDECESLQTVPAGYTIIDNGFSLNKSLSALGNGWTVDVITHILSGLDSPQLTTEGNQ